MTAYSRKFRSFILPAVTVLAVIINLSAVWGQPTNPIVLDVAWSPDGDMIAAIDDGGTLNITLSDRITPVFQFARPLTLIKAAVVWSPQGDRLAAGIGNRMYIWHVGTWQLLYDYEVGLPSGFFTWGLVDNIPEGVQTITWSIDGRYVVVGTYSYETSVWDTQEGQLIFREGDLSGGGPGRVWLNNDGWMGDGATKQNAFTGERIRPSASDRQNRFGGSAEGGTTEPRPDNTQIAWGNDTGFVLIIDLDTMWGIQGFKVADWEPPATRRVIIDISWHRTWDFIAAASRDGELYVVNLATSEVTTILNVDGQLNAVDWNPQTNEIIYAGVSESGQPILSIVDVGGIGGVPSGTPTPTFTPTLPYTPTATETLTATLTPTATFTPTFTPTPSQVCDFSVAAGDALGLVNAINAANNNGASQDTICLEEGTYTFASASNSIALPSITTPITIVGNGAIIERGSSAPNFRLFNVASSGALTLENLTIRNGNASGNNGGAILNAGSLTLNGVMLANNTARFGGGIHSSGSLVISDSTLSANSGIENGGAVYVNSGTLTLSDTTLESSSARYGSGIYLNNGTADLTGVTARANHATEQGAGVYQRTGTVTISGGLFENNTARFGNAVYVDAGTAAISDVTMRENVAVEEGAGIYNRTGSVSVADSIFEENQARYGAAISNRGTVSVAGSVFTGNSAQESGGAVYTTRSTSGNQVQQSCFEGNTARFGGAVFSSASGFNARNNWWGEVTGPTGAMVNATMLTEPFLTDGCPN